MKGKMILAATMPLLMLAAQPGHAAEDMRTADGVTQRAAFAGVGIRMALGQSRPAVPTARLRIGMTNYSNGIRVTGGLSDASAVELGFSGRGKMDFYVAGQRLTDIQHRLGVAPAAAALLAIGGLGLGAVAVSELVNDDTPRCMIETPLCTGPGGF